MDIKSFIKTTGVLTRKPDGHEEFRELEATELYCNKCKSAVKVRKYLLLVLPEGDKYEYRCVFCGEAVGTKIDQNAKQNMLIV